MIETFGPDLIHVMYYNHEDLTLIVRELAGDEVPIVFECRDPLTTLTGARPGEPRWMFERDAILASDRQILISSAQRDYYERATTSTSGRFAGHPLRVQRGDGRAPVTEALRPRMGGRTSRSSGPLTTSPITDAGTGTSSGAWSTTASSCTRTSGTSRSSGLSLEPYVELAAELDDYHHHATVPFRPGDELSALIRVTT